MPIKLERKYGLIIHAAAYTAVAKAEKETVKCYRANFAGTMNLAKATRGTPFVYISTEYVYNPVNFYSWTKMEAEKAVHTFADPYLIIRTLFKTD